MLSDTLLRLALSVDCEGVPLQNIYVSLGWVQQSVKLACSKPMCFAIDAEDPRQGRESVGMADGEEHSGTSCERQACWREGGFFLPPGL